MLIVISAIASTIALFGALLVGYSTQQTIKGMAPKRDPNSVLVAFPNEIEQELQQQQQMVSTGAAIVQPSAEQNAELLAVSLRESLNRAAGHVTGESANSSVTTATDLQRLVVELEGLLLGKEQAGEEVGALREYALRQLTTQDGTIVLPDYEMHAIGAAEGLNKELVTQLSQLQGQLNQQVAALPQLAGREVDLQNIQLGADPEQLAAAIEALDLQTKLFGLSFDESARYESLQALSEELLGGSVSLEGLDMGELEAISRELLEELAVSSAEFSVTE